MSKFKDLTGKTFGRLTVLGLAPKKGKQIYYICKCSCGNIKEVAAKHLRSGAIVSCGCYFTDKITKHGCANTRLYKIHDQILRRCYGDTASSKYYRDKGIKVCSEWLDYRNFHKWAYQNGYTDKLTIDRIDTNGNYCPENCRWVTRKEQSRNTTRNNKLKGICVSEWCELLDIDEPSVNSLRRKGLSTRGAIEEEYFLEKKKPLPSRVFDIDYGALDRYQGQANVTLNKEMSKTDILLNSCLGLAGECGEVVDIVKKWHGQGHPLDKKHIALELGDVLFYLAGICFSLNLSLGKVAKLNIIKICNRYGNGFNSDKSINRQENDI